MLLKDLSLFTIIDPRGWVGHERCLDGIFPLFMLQPEPVWQAGTGFRADIDPLLVQIKRQVIALEDQAGGFC